MKRSTRQNLDLSVIQSTDSKGSSDEITTWIFQANPKEYDILNALSDEKLENKMHWYVGQHKKRIKKGHVALIWMSGKESGIYAVAQIMSDPIETEEDEAEKPYWLSTEKDTTSTLRVKLKIVKTMINNPVFRHEVKAKSLSNPLRFLREQTFQLPMKNGSVVWINHEQGETEMLDTLHCAHNCDWVCCVGFLCQKADGQEPKDSKLAFGYLLLQIRLFVTVRPRPRGDKLSKQERLNTQAVYSGFTFRVESTSKSVKSNVQTRFISLTQ